MTDKFNPSEDLKQYLRETEIISYRLVDGSYVVAEEVDHDDMNNIIYVGGALQIEINPMTGRMYLSPWLDSEEDELIQLVGDKVVGRTETPLRMKLNYHRYFIMNKLKNVLTQAEMESVLQEMFNPPVDNQDLTDEYDDEGENWKVDNGISKSESLQKDEGLSSAMDFHKEWRKKYTGNN